MSKLFRISYVMMNDKSAMDRIFNLIQEIEDLCFTVGESAETELAMEDIIRKDLEIISETIFQVSDKFKEAHPEIQWSHLAGMKERYKLKPLVFESGSDSEWSVLVDDLLDLKDVSYYYKQ